MAWLMVSLSYTSPFAMTRLGHMTGHGKLEISIILIVYK